MVDQQLQNADKVAETNAGSPVMTPPPSEQHPSESVTKAVPKPQLHASTLNVRNRPYKTSLQPDARLQEAEAHSANSRWKHVESQSKVEDDTYLKIWQALQEFMKTRWTIVTFFMSVSFAILGFSFQEKISRPETVALRIVGLIVYWFGYVLYEHFYQYTKSTRSYLIEMESSGRTTLDLQSRTAQPPGYVSQLSGDKVLLYFGLIYVIGDILLILLGL